MHTGISISITKEDSMMMWAAVYDAIYGNSSLYPQIQNPWIAVSVHPGTHMDSLKADHE